MVGMWDGKKRMVKRRITLKGREKWKQDRFEKNEAVSCPFHLYLLKPPKTFHQKKLFFLLFAYLAE